MFVAERDKFDLESDPAGLPTERLESEITELAAHIYAATCRWLTLVAEFERRGRHLEWGFHSTTGWLAWTCGLTTRAAREHVRVARDLVELPLIREAFGRGEISYSKVRALTRAATAETEGEMLELAYSATAAQLERSVRAYRSAVAIEAGRPPADTYFAWSWDDDGTLEVRGRLSAEEGAVFIEAMHHARLEAWGERGPSIPSEGDLSAPPVTNVDALATMAEASLASTGSSSGGDRFQVVLHLDERGRCELEEGSALAPESARRLLCDSALVPITEHGGEPLTVGRKTRTIPAAIRRGVRNRDGGCRFPGCSHHRFVDGHHVKHWAEGGETSVENTVSLCRRHHRLVHEGGFTVERVRDGEFVFRRPDGSVFTAAYGNARGRAEAIVCGRREPPRLASGDRLDLDLTVESMIGVSRKAGVLADERSG